MKLYYLTLDEISQLPEEYGYKNLCREMTQYRMKIVDENESIRDIEEKISYGLIEELIFAAHNELKLLRIMKKWRPWEHFQRIESDPVYKEHMQNMTSFRHDNPFPTNFEEYDSMRHDKTPR